MTCALLMSLVDLAFPYVSRTCMYDLLPNNLYGTFFAVMGIMLAAYVIRAGLQYIVCYWGHTFGILVEADIRRDLFTHIQTLSFGFYDKNRVGHLMSRMTAELFDITELAHHGPEDLFISLVTVIGAVVVMFTIQWQLALVVAVLIPLAVLVAMVNRRAMAEASRGVKRQMPASTRTWRAASRGCGRPRHSPTSRRRRTSSTTPTSSSRPPSGSSTGPWAASTPPWTFSCACCPWR